MRAASKICGKCGGAATEELGVINGHTLAHLAGHQMKHGNVGGAAICWTIVAAKFFLPKKYRCQNCGHEFKA